MVRSVVRALTPAVLAAAVLLPAGAAQATSMSCSLNSGVVTVDANDEGFLLVGAVGGTFVAESGETVCNAWAVSSIERVVVNMGPSAVSLGLYIGSDRGYGPSTDGHTVLPTTVNATSPDLHIHVMGGDGIDRISSFPTSTGKAWGIDMDFHVDDLLDGVPDVDVALDLGPQLHLSGEGGHDAIKPGPGRPEVLSGGPGAESVDSLILEQYTAGTYADLDGRADDGGEGDLVEPDFELVEGGPGPDLLVGNGSENVLDGAGGNDTLVGRAGEDWLMGGQGADVLSGNDGEDTLEGDDGADQLLGGAAADLLTGEGDNDVVDGGYGDDELSGGDGADTFTSGSDDDGSDSVVGDAGTDTVSYSARRAAVRVSLDGRGNDGAGYEGDDVEQVENVTGGSASDVLTGNGLANRIVGGGGNDTLTGGAAADRLEGSSGNDTIYAKDGTRDTVNGGSGTDKAQYDASDVRTSIEAKV